MKSVRSEFSRSTGSLRRFAIDEVAKSMGATVEAFYFVMGDMDVIVIVDAPDYIRAHAVSIVVNASGAVQARTSIRLTPDELDQAARKLPSYRPPGG